MAKAGVGGGYRVNARMLSVDSYVELEQHRARIWISGRLTDRAAHEMLAAFAETAWRHGWRPQGHDAQLDHDQHP